MNISLSYNAGYSAILAGDCSSGFVSIFLFRGSLSNDGVPEAELDGLNALDFGPVAPDGKIGLNTLADVHLTVDI